MIGCTTRLDGLSKFSDNGKINFTVNINNHLVRLKIDTGAKCNVLSLDTFREIQVRKDQTALK